jgi:hypothetical protein
LARFDDFFECFAFVVFVAFDGFDKSGNEVVSAFELYVDIRPRRIDSGTQRNEFVVNGDKIKHRNQDNDKYDKRCVHLQPFRTYFDFDIL